MLQYSNKLGFWFNGMHSLDDYGIYMSSKNRQILPQTRQTYIDIPGRDTSLDVSDGTLGDRTIEIDCSFIATDVPTMRKNLRTIAAWLFSTTRKILVFDDELDVCYYAKLDNQIDLAQTMELGTFTLKFRAEAYARTMSPYLKFDISLDDTDVVLNPFDTVFNNVITPTSLTINNLGTAPIAPLITIVGSFTNLTLSDQSGNSLAYSSAVSNGTLVIDCDKMTCKLNGNNALGQLSGSFLYLQPGMNTISLSGSGINCSSITVHLEHKFY